MNTHELFAGHVEWWVAQFAASPSSCFSSLVFQYGLKGPYPIDRMLAKLGECEMARGAGNTKKPAESDKGQWTQFVTISLAGVTRDDIARECGDAEYIGDSVARLLASGYRVGLSYDGERDTFIASLTCRDTECVNHGRTFTSFAETWPEALSIMLFKHFVLCDEQWPAPSGAGSGSKFG